MSKPLTGRASDNFITEVRKLHDSALSAWSERRHQWTKDARAVRVSGGQWDESVKRQREEAGRPALEFPELHTYVNRLVNQGRKDRPQPKVSPGDADSTQDVAAFWEARLRHVQYASQADVAYDTALDGAATGGFGFYRVTKEFTDANSRGAKPSFNQEPRIRRILDPLTQLPDPNCQEPDYSDANFWFDADGGWISTEAFRKRFKKEPISFESEQATQEWARSQDNLVLVMRYWHVEETSRTYGALHDGTEGYLDELPADSETLNEREVIHRKVCCYLLDGEKVLEKSEWAGQYIPIVPVLGHESVVEGKTILCGIVRPAVDSQKLTNATLSGIADALQDATLAPYMGWEGQFRNPNWEHANKRKLAYLEAAVPTDPNAPKQLPTKTQYEAPIQALTQASLQFGDRIKRAVGYADIISSPSKSDLSGIAVSRRSEQAELTNFHFEDNLIRSQWHCARVVLDLDRALADTPRALKGRRANGESYDQPVTMDDGSGRLPEAKGYEGQDHMRVDVGRMDITVVSGPSYATRIEEELADIAAIIGAHPELLPFYLDIIFKLKGQPELEERAKLVAPPQVQEAINSRKGGGDPQILSQQNAQLKAQVQQMGQQLQQVTMVIKTKQIEGANKLQAINTQGQIDVEKHKLDLIAAILKSEQQHSHEASAQVTQHHFDAAKHAVDITHQTEMARAQMEQAQQQAEMAQQNQGAAE